MLKLVEFDDVLPLAPFAVVDLRQMPAGIEPIQIVGIHRDSAEHFCYRFALGRADSRITRRCDSFAPPPLLCLVSDLVLMAGSKVLARDLLLLLRPTMWCFCADELYWSMRRLVSSKFKPRWISSSAANSLAEFSGVRARFVASRNADIQPIKIAAPRPKLIGALTMSAVQTLPTSPFDVVPLLAILCLSRFGGSQDHGTSNACRAANTRLSRLFTHRAK